MTIQVYCEDLNLCVKKKLFSTFFGLYPDFISPMFLYLGRSIFMTRLKLHYAMQKWYPVDFTSINLGINLLRVQDATFTVYTVFNFEPKWCKKKNQASQAL